MRAGLGVSRTREGEGGARRGKEGQGGGRGMVRDSRSIARRGSLHDGVRPLQLDEEPPAGPPRTAAGRTVATPTHRTPPPSRRKFTRFIRVRRCRALSSPTHATLDPYYPRATSLPPGLRAAQRSCVRAVSVSHCTHISAVPCTRVHTQTAFTLSPTDPSLRRTDQGRRGRIPLPCSSTAVPRPRRCHRPRTSRNMGLVRRP